MIKNIFMERALELAEIAFEQGEVPVGAIVVEGKTGKIISESHNLVEKYKNPSFHAEIIALQKAQEIKNSKYLDDCDLYVTLEPCPLCASAISLYRIKRLYFGAYDIKSGAVESVTNFFHQKNCFSKPEVYSGLYHDKSSNLMLKFFEKLRIEKI